MAGQTCALPGCSKPPWRSVRHNDPPALACGNLHHQLLMASRLNPALSCAYRAFLYRNAVGLCALLSCENVPCLGHSWCSKKHYLSWLTDFTSTLQVNGQICMLPSCTRHVFVDDNGLPSQFCGWRHKQKFVMRSALQLRPPLLAASPNESEHGGVPSLDSRLHSLKQLALSGTPPKNIRVIEEFYEKHPWEVFTDGHACWFIACPKFTIKGRKLSMKGYHWKQSGPQVKKSNYTVTYYKHIELKRKEKKADEQHAESSYTMHEYMLEGIKSHSLIHLSKKKPFSEGKHGKEQASKHRIDDACSEGTLILSSSDLSKLIEIFIDDLAPPDGDASRCASTL